MDHNSCDWCSWQGEEYTLTDEAGPNSTEYGADLVDKKLWFRVMFDGASEEYNVTLGKTLTEEELAEWNHATITYKPGVGDDGVAKMFINGEVVDEATNEANEVKAIPKYVWGCDGTYIGGNGNAGGLEEVLIDHVHIYRRILSDDEIKAKSLGTRSLD